MAGVDGVAAVAYGTPESAAAILAASESASGVRGGLGGGGAGAASFAVGEQLQNMLGYGPWGMWSEAAGLPQRAVLARGEVRGEAVPTVIGLQGQWCPESREL